MKNSTELKELRNLWDEITALKSVSSIPSPDNDSELRELKEKLNSGLTKINLEKADDLQGEIQDTEERIQKLKRQGRKEKAQEEMEFLRELHELQEVSNKIIKLASNACVSPPYHESELRELQEKLNSGLAKINLQKADELPGEIQDTEERIQKLKRQGRKEKAQEEMEFLRELHELQEVSNKILQLTIDVPSSVPGHELKLRELKEKLNSGLAKLNLQNADELTGEIQGTQRQIEMLERKRRTEKAQEELVFLRELQELQELSKEICTLELVPSIDRAGEQCIQASQPEPSLDPDIMPLEKSNKKELWLKDIRGDSASMPSCAEKTILELIIHFEQRLLGDCTSSQQEDLVVLSLQKLQDQVKREQLLSEQTKVILRNLEMYKASDNYSSVVRCLDELFKNIRSLNVPEIQRLVSKAEKAAELIRNKDIILLVGETGTGKSTTIQFLAGATMKETRVEIASGKFLEHITTVGPIRNSELSAVNSSPLNKSETRYIAPVTVQLKDIFGSQESGVITLCDAPGFGDTAGPEVDIANGIGVIEALRGAKSVKLLALSSFRSLGDKGQGIQKLAHMLINMVHGIEDKLDAISYAFTKYPERTDINALLLDIKTTKVHSDPNLQGDTAFSIVLSDMIEKTEEGAYKIDPIHDNPKALIKKLKRIKGIQYPGEVFRFSMSEETRGSISNHAQRDKLSIICAMKLKDNDLVLYYLNDLKILKDLIKQSDIREAYDNSVRFISESTSQYCTEVKTKFNRALASQNGLEEDDIREYKSSVEYLQHIQILKEHLGSYLLSPAALMQNIISELHERRRILKDEDLHSPLTGIYLDNFLVLQNSFKELETDYRGICKEFEKRFEELVQSAHELIRTNEFKQIAEIILNIYKSAHILQNHLHGKINEKYSGTVKSLLRYLSTFAVKADLLLAKTRLSHDDVETLKNDLEVLRSAKENSALQERISTYMEMLKTKGNVSEKHNIDHVFEENTKDLNEIYDAFIAKIIKHFDDINLRIKELFDRNGNHGLEHIEKLVTDMETLRTIPELESKTATTYYRTVENVRGYMQHLQGDAEKLLTAIDQQSGIVNYRHLARSLSRLKNAEWINRVSPGAYDTLMRRITEELEQYACQLEDRLMKVDFSLKCPENVRLAHEVVEKIEAMRDLERSVPELEKHRNNILHRFLQYTQGAFDRIQKTFSLEDKDVYKIKQELKDLEEIKRGYDNLHPSRIYLQKQGYSDISMLNREIDELIAKQEAEAQVAEAEQNDIESQFNSLNSIVRKYMELSPVDTHKSVTENVLNMSGIESQGKNNQAESYLQTLAYSSIVVVYEEITKTKKTFSNKLQRFQDQNTELSNSLRRLESIKQEHASLSATRSLATVEEMSFLREKGFNSIELLDETIEEKTRVINERGNNRQSYYFSDRLDTPTANNALVYINQCEKVTHDRVREIAIDTNGSLKKYIREYGNFLNQEISRKFNHACSIDVKGGPFQYSQELEIRLQELLSISKFVHVFECISGPEKIEHWHREFLDYHRTLSAKMEEYKVFGKNRELRVQLIIAQALGCVDRFCVNVFAGTGFGTLYRQYQGEINKECKVAYKTVLDYISKGDYANADIALSDIDDSPLNPRDLAQIKHDLHSSLNKLMKDTRSMVNWLDGKIEREEDNRSQIKEIKENIDRIRIALNKHSIMDLFDDGTRNNLRSFDNEINELLSKIISKGFRSIEAFMDADSFSETEQGMENISRVQRELAGYCTSENVTKKSEELSDRLSSIVSEILKRNDFADIDSYSVNPPKDILAKLKMVASHGSARYTQAYTSMLGKIRQNFSLAIEKVRVARLDERSVKIRSLNYALCFLPDDLQIQYKLQIDELTKLIADEENAYRHDLETSFTNLDEDEHAITKIGLLAERLSKQNMHELLNKLREQSLKKLHMYRTNVQNYLDKQDIQSVVDVAKKIFKYEEFVGTYVPEIKGICSSIPELIMKGFLNCCETLGNISGIEQTQIVEQAFCDILVYLNFFDAFDKRIDTSLSENGLRNARESFQKMFQYLNANSKKFQLALDEINIVELYQIILISKKWDKLLEKISQCRSKHNLIQKLLTGMKSIILYTNMLFELEKKMNYLNTQVDVELINDHTTRFEVKREELFSNIMKALSALQAINSKFKDILPSPLNVDKLEEDLKKKVEQINTQLIDKASKDELSTKDSDDFRMYYNHLVSFEKHIRVSGIDTRHVLDKSGEKIFEKVTSLRKGIIASSSDVLKVCDILIKMKSLAENLSMFDTIINTEIDETLKIYKEKRGNSGIMSLTVELEKSEIGGRLISEHSCLSGEDWRKRREKMQKQDDLEYVLHELSGDEVGKEALRARYQSFRQIYDHLVAANLNSFNQSANKEPDVEVIVTQIKYLVGTVTHKSNSVTWSRFFRDAIPEILAHIFAVWTLQNTQHYNTMRGIEAAQSYLLMPHVGQVIAIFRLLGIGYDSPATIMGYNIPLIGKASDSLVNNLVEVGTGEGKSVVMAITACIFALTGVDVNCSCYSEVLSMRDKNDFASVFKTLGIEERIEYGTFNKLCEQLLNEQCNVREKVRDMIVTNQNTLPGADTSARIRPKVLLIDEVDVFLSDKFYGGMYTPSVYLKDPLIKTLLDTLWQNKTLKTLNSVKALPAYKTCATQYSNWIFLFDEAIKDMVVALQSYQSSTYIVQNDKIVYVEGESIVDNVVRGYDTIWAYYHENQKGTISQSSLEANAGIIINCGTFSYTEMPHDFAYIGGVTGTLKTLAKPEKEILKRVYAVRKTTFMPSVFGSSNRTYNSLNDVRVVKESESFMEIRGEIDAVCNASRAILVFFESEEKLMTFYNSPQLSSIKQDVQIIMEKVSVKERELCIKRAATVGRVTLLTRTFGRGTDFICRNQQLLLSGGIHVLQTFFSEELSEEYQIMGRGARQGDRGSYRMILLDNDLEWVLGSTWKEELPKITGSTLYDALNKARNARYESKCGAKELGIEQCKHDHKASKDFMIALSTGNIETVKKILSEQNKGANLITASSHTVLLMDATGSMSGLLSAAKETVCTMFERASIVLEEKGLPNDAFQMQFVVYRDYDCMDDGLLQSSSWETKASNLRSFMTKITAKGGGDYEEAIEIGLWHAVQQSEQSDGLSQVILIGDAPAKEKPAITRDRQTSGGEAYWNKTKFRNPTHYADELKKLKDKNIPVHAFYLDDGAKNNFQKIASETLGRCERLNINSSKGAELLTNFVTEEVLRKTAGDQGDAIVELYRKKYVKKTFTS